MLKPGVKVGGGIVPVGGVKPIVYTNTKEPVRLTPAQLEADLKNLIPDHKMGKVKKMEPYHDGYMINFDCGDSEINDYMIFCKAGPDCIGDSLMLNRFYGAPRNDEWVNNCLQILFNSYYQTRVTWPFSESAKSLPPTTDWPKELIHKMYQTCFSEGALVQAKKFLSMGADGKQYPVPRVGLETDQVPKGRGSSTSLHYVCQYEYLDKMKFLKENKLWDVTASDGEGRTPLHDLMLASYGPIAKVRLQLLDLLLTDPALDVNAKMDGGDTPLLALIVSDNWPFPERLAMLNGFLQKANPDISIKGSDGMTALQMCVRAGWTGFVKALENYKPAASKPAAAAPAPAAPAPVKSVSNAPVGVGAPPPPAKAPPAPKTVAKPAAPVSAPKSGDPTVARLQEQVDILTKIVKESTLLLASHSIVSPDLNMLIYELGKI